MTIPHPAIPVRRYLGNGTTKHDIRRQIEETVAIPRFAACARRQPVRGWQCILDASITGDYKSCTF